MPALGFGTCCRWSAKGKPLINSTLHYLSQGGRLIDTAQMYENHMDLAVAIRQSRVPRGELWVTSKVRTIDKSGHGLRLSRLEVRRQVDTILAELGLEYLDLVLLHHAKGSSSAERAVQWRGLLDAKEQGKVRQVGVSNYDVHQLRELEADTGVRPAVDQLEFHPWAGEAAFDIVRHCQAHGIAVTAYGSLGSAKNRAGAGPGVAAVAARHGSSSAQVLLRWALARGAAVIPGATSAAHIRDNLSVDGAALSAEDERLIEADGRPSGWKAWHNMEASRARA